MSPILTKRHPCLAASWLASFMGRGGGKAVPWPNDFRPFGGEHEILGLELNENILSVNQASNLSSSLDD